MKSAAGAEEIRVTEIRAAAIRIRRPGDPSYARELRRQAGGFHNFTLIVHFGDFQAVIDPENKPHAACKSLQIERGACKIFKVATGRTDARSGFFGHFAFMTSER